MFFAKHKIQRNPSIEMLMITYYKVPKQIHLSLLIIIWRFLMVPVTGKWADVERDRYDTIS